MPVVPNFIERLLMLKLNIAPGPFLDLLGPWSFKALNTGLELGIFEALAPGPLTPEQVATRIEGDERGTRLLLEALETVGYVRSKDGAYANSAMTRKWLLEDSPSNMAGLILHLDDATALWDNLADSIRRGTPVQEGYDFLLADEQRAKNFHAAMLSLARTASDEIVHRVKLPDGARRLLDLGGSHGLYSVRFCEVYAKLRATVLDWPQARPLAETTIRSNDLAERVEFREGDYLEDDLGNNVDVALLFNIIHMYEPAANASLFEKVGNSLNSGGTIVVMDQTEGAAPGPVGRAFAHLQALNQFNSSTGQTYTARETEEMLSAAGFGACRSLALKKSPGMGVVVASKP
ncbi:MAG: hypothetical protein JRI23_06610 [Deltaproteobacteria bacterium]|jgi:hypothetical protein|nr:hypothetical protein [Deltaproteobacteria bacterium]MBW2531259.1 hypothetical protein [Deltaproteobacteria bacterium]